MKKRVIFSLLLLVSIFTGSLYAEEAVIAGTIIATPVKKGIKVRYKLKKSCKGINVYRYVGDNLNEEARQLVYENTSKKSSYTFLDEYVNEGEKYTYQLSVNNEYSEPVTAIAGKGEVGIEIIPCETGLQINTDLEMKKALWYIRRYRTGDDESNYTEFHIGYIKNQTFIDEYVDANQEYIYKLKVFVKGNLGSDSYDHVFAPFCELKAKAPETGKYGDITVINKPMAVYDENTKTVTFTTLPELGSGTKQFDIARTIIYFINDKGQECGSIFRGEKSFAVDKPAVQESYRITGVCIGIDTVHLASDPSKVSIFTYRRNIADTFSEMPEIVK